VDRRALIGEQMARSMASEGPEMARMLSAGRPLANVRVRVLDEQRHDLPERRVGEIALQSDCMLTSYYNRPDLTERAFFEGYFLTGDLGYQAAGELYVTGRKKDLIIVGGKNVHPQDLEALAAEVSGVHPGRVVAFGVFDDEAGTEDVVVVAEADTEREEERQAIGDAVRLRINQGSDVAVRRVHIVGPRWVLKTSSGKVARAANREKYMIATLE
jgi:fatty-acyl-CoA synthase